SAQESDDYEEPYVRLGGPPPSTPSRASDVTESASAPTSAVPTAASSRTSVSGATKKPYQAESQPVGPVDPTRVAPLSSGSSTVGLEGEIFEARLDGLRAGISKQKEDPLGFIKGEISRVDGPFDGMSPVQKTDAFKTCLIEVGKRGDFR